MHYTWTYQRTRHSFCPCKAVSKQNQILLLSRWVSRTDALISHTESRLFEPRHPFRVMPGMERPWLRIQAQKLLEKQSHAKFCLKTSNQLMRTVYRKQSLLFRVREASVWYTMNLLCAQLYTVYFAALLLNQSILPIVSCSDLCDFAECYLCWRLWLQHTIFCQ